MLIGTEVGSIDARYVPKWLAYSAEPEAVGGRQPPPAARQVHHLGDGQAGLGSGGNDHHLSLRMLCQQTQQFDTGVTRAADDTDLDHEPALNEPLESRR